MKTRATLLLAGWLIAFASMASAGDAHLSEIHVPKPLSCCWKWCTDNYCSKPLPAVRCEPHCGCADDYCKKPLPKWCWFCPKCPDDYCEKPLPKLPCMIDPRDADCCSKH